jgi:Transglycosylase-like domain
MLTERSKKFLKKYQSGGVAPLQQLPQLPLGQVQSMTAPAIQQAQQSQALQNAQIQIPQMQSTLPNQTLSNQNQSQGEFIGQTLSNIPLLGNMVAPAYAAYQITKSFKEKRKQKRLDKSYKADLAERKQDIRNNEYVNTPYSFQEGGFNLNLQDTNQNIQAQWEEYYKGLNQQNIDKYQATRKAGIQTYANNISSQLGIAQSVLTSGAMQEGGTINTDIYSTDFDANAFLGTENSEQEMKVNQNQELLKWVFEDENDYSPIQEEYENYSPDSSTNAEGVIAGIGQSESGGDYSVINPTTGTTGKYQFHPKYWSKQIGEYMGIDGTNEEIMNEFKNSPKTQESFMNYVVNDIYKPEIKKLKPYADKYGFTEDQMVRLLHYRGLSDAKRRLISGDFKVSESEKEKYGNPDILDYIKK